MSKLLSLSVDVSKITKDKLIKGKKGTYLKLTVSVNDTEDKFGNNVSCWEEQSPDERGQPKNYLGNGKVFWESNPKPVASQNGNVEDDDDLPW